MKKLTGIASILVSIVVVTMFAASDVRGGAAGVPAGKTTGPGWVAEIVIDVTNPFGGSNPAKGNTSIRVQRSGASAAAVFNSSLINGWLVDCDGVVSETDFRFNGLMNSWVTSSVLTALFGNQSSKAAIADTDYAVCTTVDGRKYLSFTAVIQLQP